ncbi:hypothetical protein CDL15_Pgr019016 [Punica granatum]|uniref:Uncharacterized protein n=1 Tax=Punica granatum TaxID=22663 RepID=A0A218XM56_PUNGR|nr:hypothetical protein CDL15_Pgr019016 [Punica granatum]PKI74098.1 hypothetical protein CRG98_005576 [Punica granatum]
MEQKESCLQQSLGICRKLFEIITKSLAGQPYKTVTLGSLTHRTIPRNPPQTCPVPSTKQEAHPAQQYAEKIEKDEAKARENLPPGTRFISSEEDQKTEEDESWAWGVDHEGIDDGEEAEPEESKGIKKAVSFHDEVVKIEPTNKKKKKMKRIRSAEKLGLTEHDHEHLPLKSILKVCSDLSSTSRPSTQ